MIKFAHESLFNVKEEMQPLLEEHWELVALNKDVIKLNPDWEKYLDYYNQGLLHIFTARKKDKLIGYCVLVISQSLHYKDHLFANNDVVFVLPECRQDATGYKLIKYAEEYCKDHNVSLLNINTKVHVPFDSLMESMDYTLIERIYSKCFR